MVRAFYSTEYSTDPMGVGLAFIVYQSQVGNRGRSPLIMMETRILEHGLRTAQRSFSRGIGMRVVCSESKPKEENLSLSRPGASSAPIRRFLVKVIGLFIAKRPMTRTSGDSICRRR